MFVGILCWTIVGLMSGFIASKLVNLRGDDPGIGIGLGGVAGVAGGWLYSAISGSAVGFGIWSLLSAALGAFAALLIWHAMRRRSASRA